MEKVQALSTFIVYLHNLIASDLGPNYLGWFLHPKLRICFLWGLNEMTFNFWPICLAYNLKLPSSRPFLIWYLIAYPWSDSLSWRFPNILQVRNFDFSVFIFWCFIFHHLGFNSSPPKGGLLNFHNSLTNTPYRPWTGNILWSVNSGEDDILWVKHEQMQDLNWVFTSPIIPILLKLENSSYLLELDLEKKRKRQ
jgi:hypothetical protein